MMRPLEYCFVCGSETGRAGASDDSFYIDYDGPFCEECHNAALAKLEEESN